ncbi:hypothetical protein BSK59_15465 [Paenibacillus odorifer]|uniref:hypothetical protein n=1 Tax=Paenibacillus odorifer TaxID=189426 RepID=UPI00096D1344|nr:hypothetical protein [Paenibacillus odorifer]OME53978.1 hypothetical protein BSK59_15465 [Paenibacillus odorifer]
MANKNFDELRKAIMKKAKQGMKQEVLPFSKDYMSRAIDKIVYSVWQPPERKYIRRHERGVSGGLNDENNMIGNIVRESKTGFGFSIENITMPNSPDAPQEYLAPLIVLGQVGAIGELKYREGAERYPYGKPRDFLTETANELKKDKHKIAKVLETYMKK